MVEGTVKWFDKKKGYGFLSSPDGTEIFVHYTSFVDEEMRTLQEGEKVCFETVDGEKGPRSEKVTRNVIIDQ